MEMAMFTVLSITLLSAALLFGGLGLSALFALPHARA
jgi:hypothetical protein